MQQVDRWLVVIVSPAVAFFTVAKHIEKNVVEELEVIDSNMDMMGVTILQSAALAFIVTTGLTVGIGFGLGTAVSSPLRELTQLLRRLGHLDFGKLGKGHGLFFFRPKENSLLPAGHMSLKHAL